MEGENVEDWESLFKEEFENIGRQNQCKERGKLGGSLKLSAPKLESLVLRFTVYEIKKLKERAVKKI